MRLKIPVLLAIGALGTTALGFWSGQRWLLPLIGACVPYLVFLPRVKAGRYRSAVGWVLVWAVFQSISVVSATLLFPDRAGEVVVRGSEYAAEMLHWVRTGEGPEGSPRLFLPVHARHYLAFCGLSLLSLGAFGLGLGTLLLNYMNVYVAELIRASANPLIATLMGWPIWAVIRVAGFVVSGAAVTGIAWGWIERARGAGRAVPFPGRVLLVGLGLVLLDAILKAVLAPAWQGVLRRALEGS